MRHLLCNISPAEGESAAGNGRTLLFHAFPPLIWPRNTRQLFNLHPSVSLSIACANGGLEGGNLSGTWQEPEEELKTNN